MTCRPDDLFDPHQTSAPIGRQFWSGQVDPRATGYFLRPAILFTEDIAKFPTSRQLNGLDLVAILPPIAPF